MSASQNPIPPRWTAGKKLLVVNSVKRGDLTQDEAMKLYGISAEELQSWTRNAESFGLQGLRATRVQEYRTLRMQQWPQEAKAN